MVENKADFGVSETKTHDFGVQPSNPELEKRVERLRQAVREGGGTKAVARRARLPLNTLNNYLTGRDMKASAMVALADACRVSLEWLATGRGPMRAEPHTPDATTPLPATINPATSLPHGAFGHPNVDRMAEALRRAQRLYEEEKRAPSPRRLAQIILLLYDEITDEAATAAAAQSDDAPVDRD